MASQFPVHPGGQRGVALAVVLILLVVITLLALAAMRGTLLQERMSANLIDRNLGFQSAEAALREGEAQAATNPATDPDFPASGCGSDDWQGYCGKPVATNADDDDRWGDDNWEANSREATANPVGAGSKPRYMVELLQEKVPPTGSCTTSGDVSADSECTGTETIYRITARSAAEGRADVTLQSTYAVP
jgi:type IV pilus assembly protein PilX